MTESDSKKRFVPIHQKTLFVITVHSPQYRNNLFYDEIRRGINIEANMYGMNVEFLFGFQHSPGFFKNGAGVIFAPDGTKRCKECISLLKKKFHFPIVQIDNQVLNCTLAPDCDAFLGTDNKHGGELTQEYLKSFFPRQASVLVIAGSQKFPFLSYNQRLTGFLRSANKSFAVQKVLYGEFDHQRTYTEVRKYFLKVKQLPDIIFAFNDDSAIVAKKALDELNIEKNILITGFDGSAAGRVALSQKRIVCSYDQDPENLGRKAFRRFLDVAEKRTFPKQEFLKGALLTQSNIGTTFYAGVANFLDRSLSPLTFRKRQYRICTDRVPNNLQELRRELVCPIIFSKKQNLSILLRQVDADKFILVSDDNVFLRGERKRIQALLAKEFTVDEVGFPAGEHNKNITTALSLAGQILKKGISKKSCLILLGGGITGNVGGFTASMLYRGIRFIHVPTSVMQMADASTGGKQGVDSEFGKNTYGFFAEPESILIDHTYLRTLPSRHQQSGLAECIKHALCQDVAFAHSLETHASSLLRNADDPFWRQVLLRSIRLKLAVLERDSYETNEGMILVYGHTIGHAVESASKYRLTHGEAVSIGMVAAAYLSVTLGIADQTLIHDHKRILRSFRLPIRIPHLTVDVIKRYLRYDKKYTDLPSSFVLLEKTGKIYMREGKVSVHVPLALVEKTLRLMGAK